MRRAVLITGHFARQKRRGSMLWVADHLQQDGWHVTIATVGYSWLSLIRRDPRLRALDRLPKVGPEVISPTLTSCFGLPPLHPVNLRLQILDSFSERTLPHFLRFWRRRLEDVLAKADLVICESGIPVLFGPLAEEQAPTAARIYRVNDDIRLLNAAAPVLRAEVEHSGFTRISTASPVLAGRFRAHAHVTIDPMGIPLGRVSQNWPDPYGPPDGALRAVCAGTTQLDIPALVRVAADCPHWSLHVIGRLRSRPPLVANIKWHGEQDFDTTLAHIAHADVGLAPYVDAPGVEYQATNSNRILLYRHYGLPVLGPDRLKNPAIPSIIGYGQADRYDVCERWGKRPEPIPDWSDLARALAQNDVTVPPETVSIPPETITRSRVKTSPEFASTA